MKGIISSIKGHHAWACLSIGILLCLTCSSCERTGTRKASTRQQDSLLAECDRFLMELESDSLRMTAQAYMNTTAPHSREYFKGYQYFLNADFNARDYEEVLEKLDKAERMPHFADYPDIGCSYQYTRARALQYSRHFEEAIAAFKKCLSFDSPQDSVRERIREVTIEALMQLMNTYQSNGQPDSCAEYFSQLAKQPTPLLEKYAMRDVYSFLGYSLSRTRRTDEAKEVMKQTLSMPLYRPTPERRFRDYAYAASALYGDLKEQDLVIEWCNQALKAAEEYEYTAGVQWVTAMLGDIYQRTGKTEEALELYQHSIRLARKRGDLAGEANAYQSLTNLYLYWNLHEQANEYATLALQLQQQKGGENPDFLVAAYRTKGFVMYKMNRPDSALYYWHQGETYCAGLPYTSGQIDIDRQIGILLVDSCSGDSLRQGIERLRRVVSGATNSAGLSITYYQLAKGYLKQGHVQAGEAMLDSMYRSLNSGRKPVYLGGAYRFALKHYLQKRDLRNIERYAAAYLDEAEFRFNDDISHKVTEAMIAYQTEKKEQQLQRAKAELAVKELRLHFHVLLSVTLLIVLGTFSIWFFYKRRYNRIKLRLVEERLSVVLDNLEKANNRSRAAEEQLSHLLTDTESRQEIAALTPASYRKDGESKFRRRFEQLYPTFLPRLRQRVPDIGQREEILCMLIALGETTEQIVDILCIARTSVNTARYRLRRKLGLEKTESLEDTIRELIEK